MTDQKYVNLKDLWLRLITTPFVILEKAYPPRGCPFPGNLLHQYTELTFLFNGFRLMLSGGWIYYGTKNFFLEITHPGYQYRRDHSLTQDEANDLAGKALIKDYWQEGQDKIETFLSQIMNNE